MHFTFTVITTLATLGAVMPSPVSTTTGSDQLAPNEIRAILTDPSTLETREVFVNRYTLQARMSEDAVSALVRRAGGNGGGCPEADNCGCGGCESSSQVC
jgi:hypothetical protein